MLKIGTLVLYRNDEEPCFGIVTGESRLLADIAEADDTEDFYVKEQLKAMVYPVRWFDMQSVCCEEEKNLIIVSEAK